MRHTILAILIAAGACDMPDDPDHIDFLNGEISSGSGEDSGSESGDIEDISDAPEEAALPQVGDMLLCDEVPDRTAYVARFDVLPLQCYVLETGLMWATILQPNYEANLQIFADSMREEWGIDPDVIMYAAYTFSDLTLDF